MSLILFDLDDTLIYSGYTYRVSALRVLTTLQDYIAPYALAYATIGQDFEERYRARIARDGYQSGSFEAQWLEIAREVVHDCDLPWDIALERRIRHAAHTYATIPPVCATRITETLEALKAAGHQVGVLTCGDRDFQYAKLERIGITDLLDTFLAVPREKCTALAQCVAHYGRTYMVGNSLAFDICPALEAGAIPLYIPFHTWADDHADAMPGGNIHRCANLEAVPAVVAMLESYLDK